MYRERVGSKVELIDFFFQAEDGIRDLVRSRGLGDVYKRQALFLFIKELKYLRITILNYFLGRK